MKIRILIVFIVFFGFAGLFTADDLNLIALHDSSSASYDDNCLKDGCHATLLSDEQSADPRIVAVHQKMIPYIPGYNPRKGATKEVCKHCHRSVDLLQKSAAGLRQNVSPQNCAVCHSPAGPGKPLYE